MRVGILTFPNSPSYGASLQMAALYAVVESLGHRAEILNYCPLTAIHKRSFSAPPSGLLGSLKKAAIAKWIPSSSPAFARFEAALSKYPAEETHSTEALREAAERYGRILVGSDQVWNPDITGGDENYYLAFTDDRAKKAAYAPSFGVDAIADGQRERISRLLGEFPHLSAREARGAEIIRELTGREAPVVLDPTLLLRGETWERVAIPPTWKPGSYALYYAVKPSESLRAFAGTYAARRRLKLVAIGGRLRERFLPGKHPVFGAGPAEFLGLLQGAACVVTNSFHGAALSVCLHRPLLLQYSSDTNSRLIHLVAQFGLEGRVVADPRRIGDREETDFGRVESVLEGKRAESMAYLRSALYEP